MTSPTTTRHAVAFALATTLFVAPALAIAADPAPSASPGAAAETKTMENGLRYTDIVVGKGPMPKKGQTVSVKYEIYIKDKKIESSPPHANYEFILGKDQALKAMEEGVSTMQVGGKRKLIVPPELGYGEQGVPGKIEPNSTMVIDMELTAIK